MFYHAHHDRRRRPRRLEVVRFYLDHSSIGMTEVYARISPNRVRQASALYLQHLDANAAGTAPVTAQWVTAPHDNARPIIENLFTPPTPDSTS